MASVINTNMASLNAQRNLGMSQSSLNTSLQRLSSGLRINSAKDDAAGLSIATRMDSQVRGMNVGMRNANDAISFAQTAEGGLSKMTDALQRMRELAVQSANATNNDGDRTNIAAEFKQLQSEIGRLAGNTTAVAGTAAVAATPAVAGTAETAAFTLTDGVDTNTVTINGLTATIGSAGATKEEIAAAFASGTSAGAVTISGTLDSAYTVADSGNGVLTFTSTSATHGDVTDLTATVGGSYAAPTVARVQGTADVAAVAAVAATDAIPVSKGTEFNGTNTLAGGTLTFQVGANASDRISITGVDFSRQGTSKLQDAIASTVGVDTADNALAAISNIDDALSEVNTARATYGAVQNRFESVIGNLQISAENVTAAKSRIMDADFAAETAALTRGQILQQAGTAMLAQANSLPNNVLSLLRG
ncbi:MAG TPA: flagellin [Methylophilaceae bacterium]|nr:flagellin [Methylophilaceae bacterium]